MRTVLTRGYPRWEFFIDYNGNGVWDSGTDSPKVVTGTDPLGYATFPLMSPGTYSVCEIPQTGWTNSDPGSATTVAGKVCDSVTIPLQVLAAVEVKFGNVQQTGSITVVKKDATSGATIGGAKFQLWNDVNGDGAYDAGDTPRGDEVTATNGSYTWTGLPWGKYLIQETVAPTGYTLPTVTIQSATIGANTLTAEVTFRDPRQDGSITVVKKDATSGATIGGAKFQLWNDVNGDGAYDAGDTPRGDEVTATNGSYTWTDLPWGKYLIQETVAPTGYTLPTVTIQSATIGANTLTAEVTFRDPRQDGSITVVKKDATSGATIGGAKFQLWNDVNGDGAYDAGDTPRGDEVTATNGSYTWTGLPWGKYLIQETVAPTGYTLPTVTIQSATIGANTLTAEVTFRDPRQDGSITVVKKDATSGATIGGAKFQLWNDVNGDGAYDAGDTPRGDEVTATNGSYTWTDLPWGKYLIQETVAPTGYTLPTVTIQSATIGANTLTAEVTFRDPRQAGSITVVKKDATSGATIGGAKFQLWNDVNGDGAYDAGDTQRGDEVTATNGSYTWTGLPWGKYLIQETVAPTGYTLPTVTIQSATIGANTLTAEATFRDPRQDRVDHGGEEGCDQTGATIWLGRSSSCGLTSTAMVPTTPVTRSAATEVTGPMAGLHLDRPALGQVPDPGDCAPRPATPCRPVTIQAATLERQHPDRRASPSTTRVRPGRSRGHARMRQD